MLPFSRRTTLVLVALTLIPLTALSCRFPVTGWGRALDEETLSRLETSMGPTTQIQPGESLQFSLGTTECCYVFQIVEARAVWSVEQSSGARIDPATGVLTVDPVTPSGTVFTVRADVENGRRILTSAVHVYTPESNPLVGIWREEVQFSCDTGSQVVPAQPIGELVFRADGSFSVTWIPFEVYHDYWGSYTYDLGTGNLELAGEEGNYVPAGIDGGGSFSIDDQGRLTLSDLWLGSPRDAGGAAKCGHRFVR